MGGIRGATGVFHRGGDAFLHIYSGLIYLFSERGINLFFFSVDS